jgi:hypothetical protein
MVARSDNNTSFLSASTSPYVGADVAKADTRGQLAHSRFTLSWLGGDQLKRSHRDVRAVERSASNRFLHSRPKHSAELLTK